MTTPDLVLELIPHDRMTEILPLLQEHDPSIPVEQLEERLSDMIDHGFECLGVYDRDELVAICGIWKLCKYYIGRHLEIDDVHVRDTHQGRGIGKLILDWVFGYAKSNGYNGVELNCYVDNDGGNRFWKRHGFKQLGNHFQIRFDGHASGRPPA